MNTQDCGRSFDNVHTGLAQFASMGKPKKDNTAVEINGEYVKELIDWLNAKHNGRCCTSEMTSFYKSHKHLNKRKLGKLRAICKKYKTMIGYELGDPCFLSTIGRQPFILDPKLVVFEWESEACIRAQLVASVQASSVAVNSMGASKELEFYLFRERKKSQSRENRNKLRDDPLVLEEKLTSSDSLDTMADDLNIAYCDCAIALLGWDFIDAERKVRCSKPRPLNFVCPFSQTLTSLTYRTVDH